MILGISCIKLLCLAAATVVAGAVLLLVGLYLYISFTRGVCKSKNKMDGKTVIITGCTSGIGKETAKNLAKRGARVIMACRNTDNANQLKGFASNITILTRTSNTPSHIKYKKIIMQLFYAFKYHYYHEVVNSTRLNIFLENCVGLYNRNN